MQIKHRRFLMTYWRRASGRLSKVISTWQEILDHPNSKVQTNKNY